MKLWHQLIVVGLLVGIAVAMQWRTDEVRESLFSAQDHIASYEDQRAAIDLEQERYSERWFVSSELGKKELLEEAERYLLKTMYDKVFSYWYGTPWAFHGTTETPRKGKIACGYFVTTTLKHSGFRLPRVKMAQQAASVIIKSLCEPSSIKNYPKMKGLLDMLDKQPEGLYLIGLDKHVGFIYNDGQEAWFVHSTASAKRQVVKEKLAEARTVKRSKIKMVGNLMAHKKLVRAWVTGQFLPLKP